MHNDLARSTAPIHPTPTPTLTLHLIPQMLNLCYLYYLSKLTEFADTMFFVLRKKSSQITWLHVYHHSVTPLETWVLVKFLAGE